MPKPSALSIEVFLNNYNNLMNFILYAQQWCNNIELMVPIVQLDPNFQSALDPSEQGNVSIALQAAQSFLSIIPRPPIPVPPATI